MFCKTPKKNYKKTAVKTVLLIMAGAAIYHLIKNIKLNKLDIEDNEDIIDSDINTKNITENQIDELEKIINGVEKVIKKADNLEKQKNQKNKTIINNPLDGINTELKKFNELTNDMDKSNKK